MSVIKSVAYGEFIKSLREKMGISQEEIAKELSVSIQTISRMERGEKTPSYSQYTTMMQIYGESSEDYAMVFLNSEERQGYRFLIDLRCALRDGQYEEAKSLIKKIGDAKPFDEGLYKQFLMYAQVKTDENITPHDAIEKLLSAIHITKSDFDIQKVRQYRLSYNEITILSEIATMYYSIGDKELALNLLSSIKESMDTYYIDKKEKALTYPILLYNLSNYLGAEGKHDDVIELCSLAKRIAIKYNLLKVLPYILYNIACAKLMKGNTQGCKADLIESYYAARAMENYAIADIIKIDAQENFGIDFLGKDY